MLNKFLSVFALVCFLALIVFAIALISVNREDDESALEGVSQLAPDADSGDDAPDADAPPIDIDFDDTDIDDNDAAESLFPMSPPITLPLLGAEALTLRTPEGLFEHLELEVSDRFLYTGGDASLEISLIQIPDTLSARAAGFLQDFIDSEESEPGGLQRVANSELYGYFTTIQDDSQIFEAWLFALNDEFGFAVIANYRNYPQRTAIYAILDTLMLS